MRKGQLYELMPPIMDAAYTKGTLVTHVYGHTKEYVDDIQNQAHKSLGVKDDEILMTAIDTYAGSVLKYIYVGNDGNIYTEVKTNDTGEWNYFQKRL